MHSPATAVFALTAMGTPANARGSSRPIASASASAPSGSSSTNAPSCGSSASMRRTDASTTSRAETAPSRIRAATSGAGRKARASMSLRAHYSLRQLLPGKSAGSARRLSPMSEVQSGLEGVVAFATEIAEPDKEGGALRYRGVDIEELVGRVPFEQVWGLLVDGTLEPGLPPAEPHPLAVRTGDPRVDVQSALAMLGPEWGFQALIDIDDAQARDDLARASVMALSFVAQSARGDRPPARAAARGRQGDVDPRALPDPLARRGRPRPRQGDRRLLDLRRRARHERVDVHRARRRLDGRRRGRGAVGGRRRALRPAARRRARAAC